MDFLGFFGSFIHRQFIHYPAEPPASFGLEGKTVIVTGGSGGLGLEACKGFVQRGAGSVIIACRDLRKGERAKRDVSARTGCGDGVVVVWHLDMSSYQSILSFAEKANALPRLDVLLGNAGLGTRIFQKTEGTEETINTNVVSCSLLGFLLYPKLAATAKTFDTDTHFEVVGSELYEIAKFKELELGGEEEGRLFETLNDEVKANMGDRYNVSKLMVMLVIRQMAEMAPLPLAPAEHGVIINSVAPGFCHSELSREYDGVFFGLLKKLLCRPTAVGARTLVYGAGAGPETHGKYMPDCIITELRGMGKGREGRKLQEKIWVELREKLEGIKEGVTSL